MLLVQDDNVLETRATHTANQALHIRMLPGTAWSNEDLRDTEVFDPLSEGCAIEAIPIAEERPRRLVPGERCHDLRRRPLGGGMLGHVDVHHTPALVSQDHEDKEHPQRHGQHDKKIQGNKVTGGVPVTGTSQFSQPDTS